MRRIKIILIFAMVFHSNKERIRIGAIICDPMEIDNNIILLCIKFVVAKVIPAFRNGKYMFRRTERMKSKRIVT